MEIIHAFETWLTAWAQVVPLEWFVFVGAMIEEIVAPIPSPLVMTLGGSLSAAQNSPLSFLATLALIGAVGKTLGSWLVYFVADKAEDLVVNRWGKFLGVSHKEIESIGKHFNGGWRDDVILFLARAVPIMPTAPVSIGCGVIKINIRTYLTSTFLGTLVRNIFYLWLGYAGLSSAENVLSGLDSIEKLIQVLMAGMGLVLVVFMYYKRSKEKDILTKIKTFFKVK